MFHIHCFASSMDFIVLMHFNVSCSIQIRGGHLNFFCLTVSSHFTILGTTKTPCFLIDHQIFFTLSTGFSKGPIIPGVHSIFSGHRRAVILQSLDMKITHFMRFPCNSSTLLTLLALLFTNEMANMADGWTDCTLSLHNGSNRCVVTVSRWGGFFVFFLILDSRLQWKKSFVVVDKLVGLNSTLVAITFPTRHSAKSTSSLLLTVSTHIINVTSCTLHLPDGSTSDFLRQFWLFECFCLVPQSFSLSVSYHGIK